MQRELNSLKTDEAAPRSLQMSLRERTVWLGLEVLLTLVFVGIEIFMFVFNPALFALNLSIVGATVVSLLRTGKKDSSEAEEEGDP
jgi:hypothetical protein